MISRTWRGSSGEKWKPEGTNAPKGWVKEGKGEVHMPEEVCLTLGYWLGWGLPLRVRGSEGMCLMFPNTHSALESLLRPES